MAFLLLPIGFYVHSFKHIKVNKYECIQSHKTEIKIDGTQL
jgi:hypothetical protein